MAALAANYNNNFAALIASKRWGYEAKAQLRTEWVPFRVRRQPAKFAGINTSAKVEVGAWPATLLTHGWLIDSIVTKINLLCAAKATNFTLLLLMRLPMLLMLQRCCCCLYE